MADVESETADKIAALKAIREDDAAALNLEFESLETWADDLYQSLQIPASESLDNHNPRTHETPAQISDDAPGNPLLTALADEFREHIDGLPATLQAQSETIAPAQLALAQRFRIACETLGVQSLRDAFSLIEDNLGHLQDRELSTQQAVLLSRWPDRVQAYLLRCDANTASELRRRAGGRRLAAAAPGNRGKTTVVRPRGRC